MNYAPSWLIYQELTTRDSSSTTPQDTPQDKGTSTSAKPTKPAKKGRTR